MTFGLRAVPLDLRDVEVVRARRPLLIAHRGGVIAPDAPENSLAAIRGAAECGYDLVELDVIRPADDEPILFHDRAGTLLTNCGIDTPLAALTARELAAIRYRACDEPIATLAAALALCRQRGLGVMLDIKERGGSLITPGFVRRIAALLDEHGLTAATLVDSRHPLVREGLAGRALFSVAEEDCGRARQGAAVPLRGQFWFGLPEHLPDDAVPALQRNGALVIPAINTFRYPPHAHARLARDDIGRLRAAGVDGFQIDAIYGTLVRVAG